MIAVVAPSLLHARVWASTRNLGYRAITAVTGPADLARLRGVDPATITVVLLRPTGGAVGQAVADLAVLGARLAGPDWWPAAGPPPVRLRARRVTGAA